MKLEEITWLQDCPPATNFFVKIFNSQKLALIQTRMTKVNYKLLYFHKIVDLCLRSCDLTFMMECTTMHNSAFMSYLLIVPKTAII